MQFLLRCGPQLEWVVTENDCASMNIHSHFETERRTRLLNQWRSDGIDARWRDNGVDVHAESLASLLKVACESGRRNTNTPAGYTEAIAEPRLCLISRIVAKSSSDGQKQTRSLRLTYSFRWYHP